MLLGLLVYGYATGVFSTRKIEQATYEVLPFGYIAGDMHPNHDTLAQFRQQFLGEVKDVFVQILLIAQALGHLTLGNVSLDGSKIHADASKSKAVSYKRLLELEVFLQREVEELFALAEAAESAPLPAEMNIHDELARRRAQLAQLAEAKQVLEARAQARYEAEQAEYEVKQREREEKAQRTGKSRRVARRSRPRQGHATRTSTISPTRSRASCRTPAMMGLTSTTMSRWWLSMTAA